MKSSSRNGARVIWLGVHTTEGMMRVRDLRDWTAWAGSSHASSDETGALWGPEQGFVPYDQMAWTLRNGNPISENIEQCGWARWTRAEWLARPLLLDATARWLAERSKARGIPLVHLSLADIRARKPGVLGHGDYTYATGDGTHTDPGPNYPWDVVIDKARAYANGDDMPSMDEFLNYPAYVGGPSISQYFKDLHHRTRDVSRSGAPGGKNEFIQEIANAYTVVMRIEAKLEAVVELARTLAADRGHDIDVDALLTRIDERVAASVKTGLAEGVDVRVIVGDDKPAA